MEIAILDALQVDHFDHTNHLSTLEWVDLQKNRLWG